MSRGKILVRKNRNGFTLLELIVTLFIIGVITALVGPRLAGHRPGLDLKTAAGHLASILRFAASSAVSECASYCVSVDLEKGQAVVYKADILKENQTIAEYLDTLEETPDQNEKKKSIDVYTLPDGIRFEKVLPVDGSDEPTETGSYVYVFFPNGASSGGALHLINSNEGRAVVNVAFVTGVVRIET